MSRFNTDPLKQLRNRIENAPVVNIILGAGDVWYGHDWIATNVEELNVLDPENWEFLFANRKANNVLAEHVWEHLIYEQGVLGNRNVIDHLVPGGNFRIAVPDGLHPDPEYIKYVRPGGTGAGATDHKVLYDFCTLSRSLRRVGFNVELLEYWDGDGNFNYNPWNTEKGTVSRSLYFDERNEGGTKKVYTSLIIDATKPL